MPQIDNTDKITPNTTGTLFVVATPIGNLTDITKRAKEALLNAKVVICEDTRRTKKLLSHIGAKNVRLISYFRPMEARKINEIVSILLSGTDCFLCSDAGSPNISDPGALLIKEAFSKDIPVRPVPGISSVTTIMSIAPFKGDRFFFAGFLPEKQAERRQFLKKIIGYPYPIIFFETPHRIIKSLNDIKDIIGNRGLLMGRELTKLHEEIIYSDIEGILSRVKAQGAKGEITLVMAGNNEKDNLGDLEEIAPHKIEAVKMLFKMISAKNCHLKELSSILSVLMGIRKKAIYNILCSHVLNGEVGGRSTI